MNIVSQQQVEDEKVTLQQLSNVLRAHNVSLRLSFAHDFWHAAVSREGSVMFLCISTPLDACILGVVTTLRGWQ